ncbi:MAG: DUF192 domain-containing protein [Chloroflexota bacterium]|nr:DUF192 domain-containing protein [Chloroflexota bacterium]
MKLSDGAHLTIKVDGNVIADRVIYCTSGASRREGLLSLDRLERGEGILMEMPESRRGRKGFVTSIHMLGMRFPICVAWLDDQGKVVHSTAAKPWGLYYSSPRPAWYVLEVHPQLIKDLGVGVVVNWEWAA